MKKDFGFLAQANLIIFFLTLMISGSQSVFSSVTPETNEFYMNTFQMAKFHGYPIQQHSIETLDGYILDLKRIPGPRNSSVHEEIKKQKKPVLLLHNLVGSSTDFIVNGPEQSPAYFLADTGLYDVWLINFRGNTFSREHAFLDPNIERAFWDFSFEEMGDFDLPAAVSYILERTGAQKLSLLGYSTGSTTALYSLAQNGDFFRDKVDGLVAMAPLAYLANSTNFFLSDLETADTFQWYLLENNFYEAMYNEDAYNKKNYFSSLLSLLCAAMPNMCSGFFNFGSDIRLDLVNSERLDIFTQHAQQGTSLKYLIHLTQIKSDTMFKKFNYEKDQNLKYYGQQVPPQIDLSTIDLPVALLVGKFDTFSSSLDGMMIREVLSRRRDLIFYQEYDLDHVSFILGRDMSYFSDVLTVLSQF